MPRPPLSFLASLVFTNCSLLMAEPQAMTAVDLLSINHLTKGELSSDGQSFLYLQREVDWEDNLWRDQLWRKQVHQAGSERQMTFGTTGIREPQWSPDGRNLSFVTKRDGDDEYQIYLLPNDGGEARRLAELPQAPSKHRWSPDGAFIYFMAFPAREKEEEKQIKDKTLIPRFEDPERHRHLWRVEITTGEVEQVSVPEASVVDYSFDRKGEHLLLSLAPGVILDLRHRSELWVSSPDGKETEQISNNLYQEGGARFSPDGSQIAYLAGVNRAGENYYNTNLFLIDRDTRETTLIAEDFAGEFRSFSWSESGESLFLTANIGVATHLFEYQIGPALLTPLTSGDFTLTDWSYLPDQEVHLLKIQSATDPGDYWILPEGESQPARLTNQHSQIEKQFLLPRQEKITWESADGHSIEGLLTYPLGYQDGDAPFPLIVQTHGGPRSTDQYGIWKTGDFLPITARQGYGTLQTNHRGGTGYGDEFLRDMVGGYFRNSHLDVLSGVDALIERGLADPEKLVKKGWSAGGHMTNKIITITDRFKAASSGAGAVEWMSQYGESDAAYNRGWWFGGKPWEKNAPTENYVQTSVFNELWKVTTPTLIFVGEKDVRVPATQSKMLYRALRDLGVETELYVAPGEPHGFKKPSHRLFRINKELEWFEKHVHNRSYEPLLPPRS
ncbi:S9 family peptidase [Roseibacillus persicicus]|uniref:Peptidase n=1 Tax=Roseibacillus persicicus TaxID=454148 RepID=A0A918TV66_9BACT|nr:S9 family peptidase [Roseibacillus persicicus]GHC64703.1 peptidase [Roseibacillus persicicus]